MIIDVNLLFFHYMYIKVVIHLTDGLDAQYNVMKERVEQMRSTGKNR